MSPEAVDTVKSLVDAGLSVVLMFAVAVLWRKLEGKDVVINELQHALLEQSKTDADRLLDERTLVLPIVRDSTDALRRTTDQLAITTVMLERQQTRQPPIGSG
jgi:hypothetical protein